MKNRQIKKYIKYFSLLIFIFMYTTTFAQKVHIGGIMLGDHYTVAKKRLVIDDVKGTLYCYKDADNKIFKIFYKTNGIIDYDEYCTVINRLTETLNLIAIPSSVRNSTGYSVFKYNCSAYKVIIKVYMKSNNIDRLYLTVTLK